MMRCGYRFSGTFVSAYSTMVGMRGSLWNAGKWGQEALRHRPAVAHRAEGPGRPGQQTDPGVQNGNPTGRFDERRHR
jgi:hypothetical protein